MLINPYVLAPQGPFLVDDYPATAAYSLRQLRAGATNVVRVRRSSDNAEQDFTAAQITNGTLTTFCGAGNGFVRTWYDQTANGFHVAQTVAASQPQIVSSGSLILKGTRPSLQFSASRLTNSSIAISAPGHYFAIASRDSTTQNADVIMDSFNNSRQTVYNTGSTETPSHNWTIQAASSSALSTSTPSTTNLILLAALFNSSNSALRTNGVLRASGNVGAETLSGISIGDLRGNPNPVISSTYALIGKISELILYASNQTANISNIESNINTYFSIY